MASTDLRVFDGTTVTITLSGEHSQHASAGVRGLAHGELDGLTHPWDDPAPFTVEVLERHVADTRAIAERYAPLMRQLEQQQVIQYGVAYHSARLELEERDPGAAFSETDVPAPTTGNVTVTAPTEILEALAAGIEYDVRIDFRDEDRVKSDPRTNAAAAIRAQLEATR